MCRQCVAIAVLLLTASPTSHAGSHEHSFGFLAPAIEISAADQDVLHRRGIVIRILPATGHELAVLGAASIDVMPDAFLSSMRDVARLKRGKLIPQVGHFSVEPTVHDLQDLTLDGVDIAELRRCRPARCELKLTPDEIERLQRAGGTPESLQNEFRRILVERAKTYLRRGDEPTLREFSILVEHSPYIEGRMPQLAAHLHRYPTGRLTSAEPFLYWSKAAYTPKPMITITHAVILHGDPANGFPEVVVASRDIFSTRYIGGSFILTMLLRDTDSPSKRYLVYINRTWVDGLRALWRPLVEHRIRTQAKEVFEGVRRRIEHDALAFNRLSR